MSKDWEELRKKAIERDNYKCKFCEVSKEDHRKKTGEDLHVHHIIPEKQGGENHLGNLITVCSSCHRQLEETHSKAIQQLTGVSSWKSEIKGISQAWEEMNRERTEAGEALEEFILKHPIFAEEVNWHRESKELRKKEFHHLFIDDIEIHSELEFLAVWGYYQGVLEAQSSIEGWTHVGSEESV